MNLFAKYEALPQSDSQSDVSECSESSNKEKKHQDLLKHLSRFCYFLTGVCALLNLFLVTLVVARIWKFTLPEYDVHQLEHRSSYIGFDSLYQNKSFLRTTYKPIVNHARVLSTVYSTDPKKVSPIWVNQHLTKDGYVPIAERRLLVESEVSTVTQYRIMDYGMESCKLVLDIPSGNLTDKDYAALYGPLESQDIELDIWALDWGKHLDFSRLSWDSKPPRKNYVGRLVASYGRTDETEAFSCFSASYQTFEVTCAATSANCYVNAMRGGWERGPLYIIQSQTL
ncbi:hypothetical protein K435DRAFT_728711 [Dendrothele bispora CBS 962.96]|uniref:Ubiquitin 3 binding protein But2 C-terminal domain-containing protein n=1 Tax=Dendrothele bispora (strain CBS 962.96) TaxID=1314807 RepID=A0A4S8LL71_DENBC|nr:hypothetical protein K435DRAFT_728711 [Dendrothele bispora CBS 962.96]